jgi:hypothetical protein
VVDVLLRNALKLGADTPRMLRGGAMLKYGPRELSEDATPAELEQAIRNFIKERVDEEDLPFGPTLSPLRAEARKLVRTLEREDPQHRPHDGRVLSYEPSDRRLVLGLRLHEARRVP